MQITEATAMLILGNFMGAIIVLVIQAVLREIDND